MTMTAGERFHEARQDTAMRVGRAIADRAGRNAKRAIAAQRDASLSFVSFAKKSASNLMPNWSNASVAIVS